MYKRAETMTDTTLIKDLQPYMNDVRIAVVIANAKRGTYHDFKSFKATPKTLLIKHLSDIRLHSVDIKLISLLASIEQKVMNGDYDEEPVF